MKKLEHIGIAVKDLDRANALFSQLLGKPHYKVQDVESEGVRTSFFELAGVKIELLQALTPDSPVARFIAKRGEGVHHLAFEVNDIDRQAAAYTQLGFSVIGAVRDGADNKRVCFLHPKSAHGVLIELCEETGAS